MKKIKVYHVDAFTDKLFSGNPAAVCILNHWLSDNLIQSMANENNPAESSFVVPKGNDFEIRGLKCLIGGKARLFLTGELSLD